MIDRSCGTEWDWVAYSAVAEIRDGGLKKKRDGSLTLGISLGNIKDRFLYLFSPQNERVQIANCLWCGVLEVAENN